MNKAIVVRRNVDVVELAQGRELSALREIAEHGVQSNCRTWIARSSSSARPP